MVEKEKLQEFKTTPEMAEKAKQIDVKVAVAQPSKQSKQKDVYDKPIKLKHADLKVPKKKNKKITKPQKVVKLPKKKKLVKPSKIVEEDGVILICDNQASSKKFYKTLKTITVISPEEDSYIDVETTFAHSMNDASRNSHSSISHGINQTSDDVAVKQEVVNQEMTGFETRLPDDHVTINGDIMIKQELEDEVLEKNNVDIVNGSSVIIDSVSLKYLSGPVEQAKTVDQPESQVFKHNKIDSAAGTGVILKENCGLSVHTRQSFESVNFRKEESFTLPLDNSAKIVPVRNSEPNPMEVEYLYVPDFGIKIFANVYGVIFVNVYSCVACKRFHIFTSKKSFNQQTNYCLTECGFILKSHADHNLTEFQNCIKCSMAISFIVRTCQRNIKKHKEKTSGSHFNTIKQVEGKFPKNNSTSDEYGHNNQDMTSGEFYKLEVETNTDDVNFDPDMLDKTSNCEVENSETLGSLFDENHTSSDRLNKPFKATSLPSKNSERVFGSYNSCDTSENATSQAVKNCEAETEKSSKMMPLENCKSEVLVNNTCETLEKGIHESGPLDNTESETVDACSFKPENLETNISENLENISSESSKAIENDTSETSENVILRTLNSLCNRKKSFSDTPGKAHRGRNCIKKFKKPKHKLFIEKDVNELSGLAKISCVLLPKIDQCLREQQCEVCKKQCTEMHGLQISVDDLKKPMSVSPVGTLNIKGSSIELKNGEDLDTMEVDDLFYDKLKLRSVVVMPRVEACLTDRTCDICWEQHCETQGLKIIF